MIVLNSEKESLVLKNSVRPWLRHWPKNVPLSIEYPEISLDSLLQTAASKAPNEIAGSYSGTGISYANLDLLVSKFSGVLQSIGVRRGDRVALALPNIPQFIVAFYGALRAGAAIVTLSPLYRRTELSHILADSGTDVVVALDKLHPDVQAIIHEAKLRHVITTSAHEPFPPSSKSFSHSDVSPVTLLIARLMTWWI
jgi:long-chain acyl-CoA synthetase